MKTVRQTKSCATALLLAFLTTACSPTRVIYVPHGEPVRLAEPVKARVWVKDASGKVVKSENKITIPEGWYALPK